MKQYHILLLGGIYISLSGCGSSKTFFRNKILIYNTVSATEPERIMVNTEFIDFYNDTINRIGYPYNSFDKEKDLIGSGEKPAGSNQKYVRPNIYPFSNIPFKFTRNKKTIYINYTFEGKVFKDEYYQISERDSVITSTFIMHCTQGSPGDKIITKYANRDTSILVESKKIKCWIFEETFPYKYPPVQKKQVIYLSKKSLLPIQVDETYYYSGYNENDTVDIEAVKSKISAVLPRPWNSNTKKWVYPKCY